jgi:hypothetical protein
VEHEADSDAAANFPAGQATQLAADVLPELGLAVPDEQISQSASASFSEA